MKKSYPTKPEVSVIIVSYNTMELLLQSIASVYRYTKDIGFEIIVVDNASSDDSVPSVKMRFPEVIVIANKENAGFGKANNQAIKIANGKYVFLLNSDAFLTQNTLLHFYWYMESEQNHKVAACGADLIGANGKPMVSFGNFPSITSTISELGFFFFFKKYYYKHLSSVVINYDDNIKEIDYLSGADMFIRKEILEEVGLFDEDFFLYYEETELSYRMQKRGYKSVIIPSQKVIHLEGHSQLSDLGFNYNKYRIYMTSRILFYKKCYGSVQAIMAKWLSLFHLLIFTSIGKEKGKGSLTKKIKILLYI